LPYFHISKVFSDKTGTTLEKYIILVKIERVKELLSYDEMTLSEIAYMMGYSAVQYLSNQFKQVTGYTVTEYKTKKINDRKPLDTLLD
jgi:AraC-like DNA-binding protein